MECRLRSPASVLPGMVSRKLGLLFADLSETFYSLAQADSPWERGEGEGGGERGWGRNEATSLQTF